MNDQILIIKNLSRIFKTGKHKVHALIETNITINKGEFVVLYGTEKEHRGHLVFACSESLELDMRELLPVTIPLIEGRGGGRSTLVELAGEKE